MRNSFKEVALATKAKTPARTQGFFQFQMVAPGRNRPGLEDVGS